jgi:4-hydroxythreonine-4-phosphate dehydrogenase
VVLGDRRLLEERAAAVGLGVRLVAPGSASGPGTLAVEHLPLGVPSKPGVPDPRNARYVITQLERAADGCLRGEFAAMATAPVHKAVINDAGIPFVGHTEFLAERTRTPHVVMMLAGGGLRVALATTHMALKDVPGALDRDDLEATLRVLISDLRRRFGVASPRILVAGLNPHGGESGHFGREEIEIIAPVLERLRAEGLRLVGPLPADTVFTPDVLAQGDCVLAMYHDQGLPVLKYASFGRGINVTLGLPIVRTSVDHGTALDIAGTGKADAGSLVEAVRAAIDLSRAAAEVAR